MRKMKLRCAGMVVVGDVVGRLEALHVSAQKVLAYFHIQTPDEPPLLPGGPFPPEGFPRRFDSPPRPRPPLPLEPVDMVSLKFGWLRKWAPVDFRRPVINPVCLCNQRWQYLNSHQSYRVDTSYIMHHYCRLCRAAWKWRPLAPI